MTKRHVTLAVLVVASALVPLAAGSGTTTTSGAAYSGSHVSFETTGNALVDYSVDGDTVFSEVAIQSQSEADGDLGLGASGDLASRTDIAGAALSMNASSSASATLQVDSGANVTAHDHSRGTLVVEAEDSQYVELGVNGSSSVETESDSRALVRTESGTTAAVLVTGNGSVAVNEQGNLTASVESDSHLVVRSYTEARTEADVEAESMIANGTAAGEVYVDDQDGERIAGSATFDSNTSISVDARSDTEVNVTINRSEHDGKVVLASASTLEAESNDDIDVRVDGQAAAEASTYGELRAAADNGSTSKYMVNGEASADAEVFVAVNHFSERSVTMSETENTEETDSTGTDGSDTTASSEDSSETDDGSTDSDSQDGTETDDSESRDGADGGNETDDSDSQDGADNSDATDDGDTDDTGGSDASETGSDTTDDGDTASASTGGDGGDSDAESGTTVVGDDSEPTTADGDGDGTESGDGPGFGAIAAVLALAGLTVYAIRRQ